MNGKMFMRVEDVAEKMGVSVSYAYKLIRKLNEELKKQDIFQFWYTDWKSGYLGFTSLNHGGE